MKPLTRALQAAFGTMLVLGCATTGDPGPAIKPVYSLQHGGAQAEGYYQLGRYYDAQRRPTQAIAAYRTALQLDDRLSEAHAALGAAYALQGEFGPAIVELDAAIALAPAAAHLHNNLGYAYYLQGDQTLAIAAFEKAAALDPANPRPWNNMGLALERAGEVALARTAFDRAIALAAMPPAGAVASGPGGTAIVGVPAALAERPASTPLIAPAAVELSVAATGAATAAVPAAPQSPLVSSVAPPTASPIAPPIAPPIASPIASPIAPPVADATAAVSIVAVAPNVYELTWSVPASAPIVALPAPGMTAAATTAATTPATRAATRLVNNAAPAGSTLASIPAPFGLEVANGNGVTGMARRTGGLLAAVGLPAARLTNQKPFTQQSTEIHYREGYAPIAAALGARLPSAPALIRSDRLRPGTDVRLVLGRDLPPDMALVDPAATKTRLADAAPGPQANTR